MQIYVCIKNVPDSAANIAIKDGRSIDENVAFLLNPYDEHGLTEAVRLKKQIPDSEIIAVCLGKKEAEKTVRSALAMGADRGILVQSHGGFDSMATARILKTAIEQDGKPDLIFTGKESIDCEGMQTMFRLGARFGFPVVNNATGIEIKDGRARVTEDIGEGKTRILDLAMPCVIGAGRGLNTPAYPTFPDIVKARKKSISLMAADDPAGDDPKQAARVMGLEPLVRSRSPRQILGTPQQVAARILTILKEEAKVIQ